MTIDEYQAFTKTTAIYPEDVARTYLTMGLAGEIGEVLNLAKKEIRDGVDNTDKMVAELSDCLYYLSALADNLDVSMSELIDYNVDKLTSRKERGVIGGEGDNR